MVENVDRSTELCLQTHMRGIQEVGLEYRLELEL